MSRPNTIILDCIDSTNNYLKKLAKEGAADGTAVIARRQTAGKGRCGNSFQSDLGGLYMSMLVRTEGLLLSDVTSITTKTAVAVAKGIELSAGVPCGIKWVNDIVLNRKKICGILVEAGPLKQNLRTAENISTSSEDPYSSKDFSARVNTVQNEYQPEVSIPYVVIGVGINVNTCEFADDISSVATSLKLETGRELNIEDVANAVISSLDKLREHLTDRDSYYLEQYRYLCATTGKNVTFVRDGIQHTCYADSISDDYGLKVFNSDGSTEILRSGEVHVRGLEGYV